MGIYEFLVLDLNDKAEVVWNKGIYHTSITKDSYKVNLYSIDAFFAEVYYSQKDNEIIKIRQFKSVKVLNEYLDAIELDIG